jgi:hypothetical protein
LAQAYVSISKRGSGYADLQVWKVLCSVWWDREDRARHLECRGVLISTGSKYCSVTAYERQRHRRRSGVYIGVTQTLVFGCDFV